MNRPQRFTLVLFMVSLIFFFFAKILPVEDANQQEAKMAEASEIMKKAISALSLCSAEKKQFTDKEFDINGTGLIGLENSPITT
ncbi:MAG: hypothetical protein MUP98_21610, partial [Candidatus Aminicenantes bacterium]|nr:hypothetical protein [Candidatus Aminicenantes bacterium]